MNTNSPLFKKKHLDFVISTMKDLCGELFIQKEFSGVISLISPRRTELVITSDGHFVLSKSFVHEKIFHEKNLDFIKGHYPEEISFLLNNNYEFSHCLGLADGFVFKRHNTMGIALSIQASSKKLEEAYEFPLSSNSTEKLVASMVRVSRGVAIYMVFDSSVKDDLIKWKEVKEILNS